jgi:hypothetical protein
MAGRMYAVFIDHGPEWDDSRSLREQDGWDEHAAFMDALVDDGFIVLGGPIGDGSRVLHAVFAEDPDAIRARLGADPWSGSRLRIARIEPWTVLLDGRAPPGATAA